MIRTHKYGIGAPCVKRAGLLSSAALYAVVVAAGYTGNCASAQQIDAPSAEPAAGGSAPAASSGGIEEVVVTARRRSETLSKTPVAVSAFTAQQLAEHTFTKETDLQVMVPGLTVKTTGSQNQLDYAIRGQTLDAFSGSSPGVLAYFNEVQISSQTAAQLYDLSSVQVLKGPQGTLFGRNAVGGAVLYATAQPGDEYGGFADLRLGDYDLVDFRGAVDVPVVPGKLAVRVAGDIDRQTGYVVNLKNNGTLGDTDATSGRLTVKATPTDALTNLTVFQYGYYGGTDLLGELVSANQVGASYNGTPLNATGAAIYGNALFNFIKTQQERGSYVATLPGDNPRFSSHTLYLANTTTYELTDTLSIKNIASLSNASTITNEYLSGSPYGVIDLLPFGHENDGTHFAINQWSEELQLSGHVLDDKLKFVIGAYASYEKDRNVVPVTVGLTLPAPAAAFFYNYTNTDHSKAIYAQGTYDLSDLTGVSGLSLTAGGRQTWESLFIRQDPGAIFYGAAGQEDHEENPSWTLSVEYQMTPHQLFYFTTRGSWRAGNFNGTTPPTNNQNFFRPEFTHDFEIGSKSTGLLFDKAVRLNVALYDQLTSDVQRDVYFNINGSPASFTHNVPRAEVQGVEWDGEVQLNSWLGVGSNGAYTFARYTNPNLTLFGQSLSFSTFQDTPRWSGTIYANVLLPTPVSWGDMTVRAEAYYQSTVYISSLYQSLDPGTKMPNYALVNLRYDWKDVMGSDFSVSGYINNLLERRYYLGGYALGADIGINTFIPGAPRQFGVELKYTF